MIKIGQFEIVGYWWAALNVRLHQLPADRIILRNHGVRKKKKKVRQRNFMVKVDVTKIYMGHSMGET